MSFEDRHNPCPICQATTFFWGRPTSDGGVWFKPDETVGAALGASSDLLSKRYGMVARVCQGCGNVQLFLKYFPEPAKEKRKNE